MPTERNNTASAIPLALGPLGMVPTSVLLEVSLLGVGNGPIVLSRFFLGLSHGDSFQRKTKTHRGGFRCQGVAKTTSHEERDPIRNIRGPCTSLVLPGTSIAVSWPQGLPYMAHSGTPKPMSFLWFAIATPKTLSQNTRQAQLLQCLG